MRMDRGITCLSRTNTLRYASDVCKFEECWVKTRDKTALKPSIMLAWYYNWHSTYDDRQIEIIVSTVIIARKMVILCVLYFHVFNANYIWSPIVLILLRLLWLYSILRVIPLRPIIIGGAGKWLNKLKYWKLLRYIIRSDKLPSFNK